MPNAKERMRAVRDARFTTIRQRADVVAEAFPGVNRHLAGQVACTDRLWGPDEPWRNFVAASNVAPCQLSCCNPTT